MKRSMEFEFGFEPGNFAMSEEGTVFFQNGKEKVQCFMVSGNGDAFVLLYQIEVLYAPVADDFAVFFLDTVEFEPVSFGIEAEVLEIFAVDFEFFVGVEFVFREDFLREVFEVGDGLWREQAEVIALEGSVDINTVIPVGLIKFDNKGEGCAFECYGAVVEQITPAVLFDIDFDRGTGLGLE